MLNTKGNSITYLGHSTFSLTTASGQVALIDPWVMTNPWCPEELKNLPRLDAIFLTHAHTDHLGDLLTLTKQHRPKIAAIFETCLWIESKGFVEETCPMGKGGSQKIGDFEITMTHAFHSNSIEENGVRHYGGEPAGYIIRMPGMFTVYHAGDTAAFGDMKLIGELYKPDLAMLPIGDRFTMGPREAAYAIRLLGVKQVIPMHYGTFAFLTGTVEELRNETKKIKGLKIHALKSGETTMIRSQNLRSGYIQDDVEEYLYNLLPERDQVVKEMEDYAEEHHVPIIGPAVARLLTLLVQASSAKLIFEMGSAIGYSTVWLARAAGTQGKVFYTDGDPEKAKRAQVYFRMAGVAKRVEVQVGDALALVKKAPGKFDMVFIDVDKHQYPTALVAALPKLRRGGLLVADNTLWSGKAARPAADEDKDTKGIQEFNRVVYASKELYPVLIPLRDGVTVCVKQ